MFKETYNTMDNISNPGYNINPEINIELRTFDNRINQDDIGKLETFEDDDEADIDDSWCIDEVTVSQRAINWSFINIKRNQPLSYKLKKYQNNV